MALRSIVRNSLGQMVIRPRADAQMDERFRDGSLCRAYKLINGHDRVTSSGGRATVFFVDGQPNRDACGFATDNPNMEP